SSSSRCTPMLFSKTGLCLALAALPAVYFVFRAPQPFQSNSKPEDQVLQLERDWLAADGKADTAALRHLVADDFMGGASSGTLLSKEDIIPRSGDHGAFAGAIPTDTTVRVFGDTAVLMGYVKNADSELVRVTLVCQKRAQGWQMIAMQLAHP